MAEERGAQRCLLHLLAMGWDRELPGPGGDVAWEDVLALAQRQEVTHLLHLPASRLASGVPKTAQVAMREAYLRSGALNSHRFCELQAVLRVLAQAGAPVILLKGAALAEALYGNLALRPMGDLDLAVPRESMADCHAALCAAGYRPNEAEERPGSHLVHRGQRAYRPPAPLRSPVGLHWHPLDLPYYLGRMPARWFWNNSGTHKSDGLAVQVLTPRANLVYLPAHFALHHRLQGLPWLVDLAWLVHAEGERADWEWVVAQAQGFELILALRAALELLSALWPALPLDEPRRRLAVLKPTASEQRMFRLLTTEPRTKFLDFASDIAGLPGFRSRARFVLANTFPQRSYMLRRYPVGRPLPLPAWYAYRLGDGAVKSMRTLAQLARLRR
jgi:hypothetical protein